MSKATDVAIVGAGPYGLSIAAHLRARGINHRIVGSPMHTWRRQMPQGMRLKSEGFASSLSDVNDEFTLGQYCQEKRLPYADVGLPVPIETFISYGMEFQKRFVPELEEKCVVSLKRTSAGFELATAEGEAITARRVVMAVGICHFGYLPPELAGIPGELLSHSSEHSCLDRFRGREVIVIGAGASAVDLVALLHQAGAAAQLVARSSVVRFHNPPSGRPRTLWERINLPMTGIGSGWKLYFYANKPHLFHMLPEQLRLEVVRRTLGPAPGWFVKKDVVGVVPMTLGVNVTGAKVAGNRISLSLDDASGSERTVSADHVVAATGYRVDLRRLTFLDSKLLESIRCVQQSPVVSSSFESSVPGLYFVGTSVANSFGPVLRFAFGARFTAHRLSRHLAKAVSRHPSWEKVTPRAQVLERG